MVFLQARAQAMPSGSSDQLNLLAYYQRQIGLSGNDISILNSVATAADAAVKAQDAKAQAVISQFRANYPASQVYTRSTMPKAPAELAELWTGGQPLSTAMCSSCRPS